MKKLLQFSIIYAVVGCLLWASTACAAPITNGILFWNGTNFGSNAGLIFNGGFIANSATNTITNLVMVNSTTTNATTSRITSGIVCLTGDICRSTWPTSGGGGSNSKFATSTNGLDIFPNGGGGLIVTASSSLLNLMSINSTSTNSTTTNLYVSNRVGIGTTSPAVSLDISVAGNAATARVEGNSNSVGSSFNIVDNTTVGNSYSAILNPSGASNANVNTVPNTATFSAAIGTTGGLLFTTRDTNAPIRFYTGGNSLTTNFRMTILGNGNVGIATVTPSTSLEVNGTTTSASFAAVSSATSSIASKLTIGAGSPFRSGFGLSVNGNGGIIASSTNPANANLILNCGFTSAYDCMQSYGANGALKFELTSDGSVNMFGGLVAASVSANAGAVNTNTLSTYNSGTIQLFSTIDANSQSITNVNSLNAQIVSAGTYMEFPCSPSTTPTCYQKWQSNSHLNKWAMGNQTGADFFTIWPGDQPPSPYGFMLGTPNGSGNTDITWTGFSGSSGDYLGGDASFHAVPSVPSLDQVLTVGSGAGGIGISNTGTITPVGDNSYELGSSVIAWSNVYAYNYPTPSDRRFKNSIATSTLGLDFIKSLQPVSYKYNLEGTTTKPHYGLIAQDVAKALGNRPFAGISIDANGYYHLDYTSLVAPLIQSVKDLDAKVESLEARLDALERKP